MTEPIYRVVEIVGTNKIVTPHGALERFVRDGVHPSAFMAAALSSSGTEG